MITDVSATNSVGNITARTINPNIPPSTVKPKARDVMKTEPPISMDEILEKLADISAAFNKRLAFSINEKLDQVVVKVIDTDTDKVIREIPPTELQHVHERIREVIGILFDERA